MSELDDKLKEILEDGIEFAHDGVYLNNEQERLVAQIKQAFADEIGKMLEIQGVHGTWDYDSYMHGMYNGIEFCHSLVKGVEPKYRKAPDKWLTDRPEMTGQEWYERFEKELNEWSSVTIHSYVGDIENLIGRDITLKAAKRAAGIEE